MFCSNLLVLAVGILVSINRGAPRYRRIRKYLRNNNTEESSKSSRKSNSRKPRLINNAGEKTTQLTLRSLRENPEKHRKNLSLYIETFCATRLHPLLIFLCPADKRKKYRSNSSRFALCFRCRSRSHTPPAVFPLDFSVPRERAATNLVAQIAPVCVCISATH